MIEIDYLCYSFILPSSYPVGYLSDVILQHISAYVLQAIFLHVKLQSTYEYVYNEL